MSQRPAGAPETGGDPADSDVALVTAAGAVTAVAATGAVVPMLRRRRSKAN